MKALSRLARYALIAAAPPLASMAPAGAVISAATSQHGELQARAERTDYAETSSYTDVVDFLARVASTSDRIHLTQFGYTNEGRALPLVVVGDVENASAAAVRNSGKLRVYLQGNIHGGEVCGKEALLMLLRDLANGAHPEWDDNLVLLVAPLYNADGNERVALTNRPRQNGPIGGMGQRPNAQGLDLNRDHMKVDSPEARSLLAMFNAYDPQVGVDLHTTNGSRHAYHLTYAPPLNPNTHPAIDALLRDDWLPAITASIKAKHGQDFYYYAQSIPVERFHISDSSAAERDFQGHRVRTLEGAYATVELEIPAGTWRVDVDQPLGRLAFYLLEPRSDDGLVEWNFLDEAIDGTEYYPILRIPAR